MAFFRKLTKFVLKLTIDISIGFIIILGALIISLKVIDHYKILAPKTQTVCKTTKLKKLEITLCETPAALCIMMGPSGHCIPTKRQAPAKRGYGERKSFDRTL